MTLRLLVEGWRGISHSYALVNQHQLAHLSTRTDIELAVTDLPFHDPRWSRKKAGAGFSPEAQGRIDRLPPDDGHPYDATYRIGFPYRLYPGNGSRTYCFGTSEYQVLDDMLYEGPESEAGRCAHIITPSQWSKEGFLRGGFEESQVSVIPHGVNFDVFKPEAQMGQACRARLGLPQEAFVFLNVGFSGWNKGIDLLCRAFVVVAAKHPTAILLLKDQSSLYGLGAETVIRDLVQQRLVLQDDEIFSRIHIIKDNLSLEELNGLYNAANLLVAPYRAEGFNMTPLEAVAAGTPVAVTAGGPTDDFLDDRFAVRIPGVPAARDRLRYIEPDLDALVSTMENSLTGRIHFDVGAALPAFRRTYGWAPIVDRLVRTICG